MSKTSVLAKFPTAHSEVAEDGAWEVWAEVQESFYELIGSGESEAEAWALADQFNDYPPFIGTARLNMQDELKQLLERYAEAEGTTMQAALRDAITDLRHLAEYNKLDFEAALEGAEAVFEEEQADTH